MSHVSDLCNFFADDDRVFFPDFHSRIRFIVKGAIMDIRVSVNTTEYVSTAAVETCNIQRHRNEQML